MIVAFRGAALVIANGVVRVNDREIANNARLYAEQYRENRNFGREIEDTDVLLDAAADAISRLIRERNAYKRGLIVLHGEIPEICATCAKSESCDGYDFEDTRSCGEWKSRAENGSAPDGD